MPITIQNTAGGGVTLDSTTTANETVNLPAGGGTLITTAGGTMTGVIANFTSTGIDDNATSTAVTIDANENVLLGKTSQDSSLSGCELLNNGTAQFTRDGNSGLRINRLTSDGELLRLSKDGTTVGSIISDSGSIMLGSGDVGVYFDAASDRILPTNITTGSVRNDAIDIGGNPHRFKDLYLSGGVYLGGTGAANKLDDYEEGTWTPVVAGGITINTGTPTWIGAYTKIGNKVFYTLSASGTFSATFAANAEFSGLPFSVSTIDTGLIHDASGGEKSITETYSNEHIYILDVLGSGISQMLRGSGSYTTT